MAITIENLSAYQADVERRAAEHARAKAGQLTHDGRPILPPDKHAQRMAEILQPLEASVQDAYDVADRATAEADALLAVQWADPLAGVPTEELTRMAALRPWVEQEAKDLTGELLRQRLLWALHHGDNATRRLYLLEAIKHREESWYSFILPVAQKIEDSLTSSKDKEKQTKQLESAAALRQRAIDLRMAASDALRGARQSDAERQRERMAAYGGPI